MKKIRKMLYLKFARRLNRSGQAMPVPSIISENSVVEGNIASNGIVHIDGHVKGNISCDELVIGLKGSVEGDVIVQDLHLFGTLKGKASVDSLFVAKTAKLIGEAAHNSIAVEPGAYVDGLCLRSKAREKFEAQAAAEKAEKSEKKAK